MEKETKSMDTEVTMGTEVTMKEFVTNSGTRDIKKKAVQAKRAYARKNIVSELLELLKNKQYMALLLYALVVIAGIIVSIFVCEIPVVPVCMIVVIEALLAVCLHNLPIWLHGVVIVIQIISGIIFEKLIFMILTALLYLGAIFALRFIIKDK